MNDLQNKNIKISGAEDVGWGIKLKSETGEIFNVPKLKKDTQDKTVAFKTLEMLNGWGMGLTKNVKFATVPNKQGGNSKYVRMIGEPEMASNENMGAEQVIDQHRATKPLEEQSLPSNPPTRIEQSQENTYNQEKPNWDDINFGKCKHQFLLEAFKQTFSNFRNEDEIEKKAEQWATMSMRIINSKEKITGDESFNQPLGNNGEEKIPDGQREDTAELNEEDIKISF